MRLASLITSKKIKTLHGTCWTLTILFSSFFLSVNAQDNSPYSRYGIGDLVPSTHIINRAMGGISAGYVDNYGLSINFNNPASYSSFQTLKELKSKKIASGRAVFDVGLNFDNRTLKDPATAKKFVASNALFSYVQIGVPLKSNWGLSFGLRPISRISYNIAQRERLKDPNTGLPIDSALTLYQGNGGSYLASIGTGFKIKNLSLGVNGGYLFGKKDYKTKRTFINDSVFYYQANFETSSNFGSLYFDAGMQYKIQVNKKVSLTLGAYGNLTRQLNARKDILRETFVYDPTSGDTRLDSVYDQRDLKGKLIYPSSYTFGFVLQKFPEAKEGGWLIGVDFMQQNWDKYRYFGEADLVMNKWELRVGTELRPVPTRNYLSYVTYRFGFFIGPDYIKVDQKLPQFGISMGMGLPLKVSRQALNQATLINFALEYGKRGNNNNLLRENTFRFSLGFSLSDFWFIKRKYD
ncbi:MAG: hypothetical protein JJE22_18205 [Bacteroidia bacterium]|nr:hypothetical protein [Bacteroidia bacterium]